MAADYTEHCRKRTHKPAADIRPLDRTADTGGTANEAVFARSPWQWHSAPERRSDKEKSIVALVIRLWILVAYQAFSQQDRTDGHCKCDVHDAAEFAPMSVIVLQ